MSGKKKRQRRECNQRRDFRKKGLHKGATLRERAHNKTSLDGKMGSEADGLDNNVIPRWNHKRSGGSSREVWKAKRKSIMEGNQTPNWEKGYFF